MGRGFDIPWVEGENTMAINSMEITHDILNPLPMAY
jgi:hypothetical protein